MPSKLTKEQRIQLIKRVLEKGESVTAVCKEAGVSRVVFYRWLAYYKNEQEQQKSLPPKKLSPHSRIDVIERVAAGESVARICELYGISRTLFYRWQDRYEKAPEGQKLEALWDKKPVIERYYKQASEEYEDAVLAAVRTYPELSTHKLVEVLPHIGGRPILGNHGVQNVLKRHNLNTYESRIAFAAEFHKPTTATRFFGIFHKLLTLITTQSPQPRSASVRFAFISAFALFTVVSLFGTHQLFRLMFGSPSFVFSVGLMFSLVSLFFGMMFFIYSIKYYFTIAVVLSFSRHSGEKEEEAKESYFNTIYSKLFGQNSLQVSNQYSGSGGLQPDLSGITLERKPFVSIQLASYNEKRVIDRLLTAATSMEYENYEVILADDSNDETLEIIEKWKSHPRVKVVHRKNRDGYKGMALQNALKHTDKRTEFMIVFDADFIPYPDTITQFLKHFQSIEGNLKESTIKRSKIGALQGYQWHVLNKSENWITRGVRSEYAGSYVIERSAAEVYGGLKQIAGSVYMIRKDVVEKIGWGKSITEDFEFTLKMYEQGYKVVYTPYIQAPAEAVSTIKRMIRQRMRWAEGHSFNIKKMLVRLLVSSNLTTAEKFEVVYLTPYYLQAAFFIIGTLSWFIAEVIFQVRLPFWTETWGWSLVFTNMFALPLMNMVGLFLEESEEKDYLGLFSFVGLSYIVAPFQAYAAAKGFLEKEEGPWFRTPKSGKITDVFTPGRFYRYVFGFLGRGKAVFGKSQPAVQGSVSSFAPFQQFPLKLSFDNPVSLIKPFEFNPYLLRESSHNRFSNFRIRPKRFKKLGNIVLFGLITTSIVLSSFSYAIPQAGNLSAYASEPIGTTAKAAKEKKVTPQPIVLAVNDKELKKGVEITNPRLVKLNNRGGSSTEFVFHKNPRVRIKIDGRELDFQTDMIGGMLVEPKQSLIIDSQKVVYVDIVKDVDLVYTISGDLIVEEFIVKNPEAAKYFDKPIQQTIKTVDVKVVSPEPSTFGFYSDDGKELFKLSSPFAKDSDDAKTLDIKMTVEKANIGHKLSKILGKSAQKWLVDPMRVYPISIDPTVIVSAVIESSTEKDVQFGGLQRKIVYSSSNFYAFFTCETDPATSCATSSSATSIVYYKKSADGVTWAAAVRVSATDTDNWNPSVDVDEAGTTIMIFWVDGDTDAVQGMRLTTAADTLGTECSGTDQGTFTDDTNYMVSVAAFTDALAYVSLSDTSTDTEFVISQYGTMSGVCVERNVGLPAGGGDIFGPGITAGDRPVLVKMARRHFEGSGADQIRHLGVVFQDGNLSFSEGWIRQTGGTDGYADWVNNNMTVAQITDDMYSVTTDGIYVWILTKSGTTGTNLYKCCKESYTPTVIDSDIGDGSEENIPIDMYCVAANDCKIVYTDDVDTTSPDATFVDCNDTICSSNTATDLDIDTGGANDAAGSYESAIYCVATDNCKVLVTDDMDATSGDLDFYDCADTICSSKTETGIDTNIGTAASTIFADVDCAGGDEDCKVIYNDHFRADLFFVDCANSLCNSTGRTITTIDTTGEAASKTDVWCPAADGANCRFVFNDSGIIKLTDCNDSICSSRTTTQIEAASSVDAPSGLDCAATDDCKVWISDGANGIGHFMDCSNSLCSVVVDTSVDDDAGGPGVSDMTAEVDCVSATDCKTLYAGIAPAYERNLLFVDCGDASCTTGSNHQLQPNAQLSGALYCITSDDCKMAYIKSNTGVAGSVEFVDLSTTNGFQDGRWDETTLDSTGNDTDSSVDITCLTTDNCKGVYYDKGDDDLVFFDCNDANCSSPTQTDLDIGLSGDTIASIYCPASDDCKVIYSDNSAAGDVFFVDCTSDEDCSTNTITSLDATAGTITAATAIYCPTTSNCKVAYSDKGSDVASTTDLTFIDCANTLCSSQDAGSPVDLDTDIDALVDGASNSIDIFCVAADDCKVVYNDSTDDDATFIDCASENCSSQGTGSPFDVDIDVGARPKVGIYCPASDDCKFGFSDNIDQDISFADCADTVCSSSTITDIDTAISGNVQPRIKIDCLGGATDCKVIYSDADSKKVYFADCADAACSTSNITTIDYSANSCCVAPGGVAISCISAIDCKLIYTDQASNAVKYVNCNDALCSPMALEPPFTDETELESVSITYDGTNTKLYSHVIKDSSDQAYFKDTAAGTISWGASTSYGFTAGNLAEISSIIISSGSAQIGVTLRQGNNFEFATVPENLGMLLLVAPLLPGMMKRLRRKR